MDLKAIFEIKLMLGGLEASRVALAEMRLYAYYVLNGHSDYQTEEDECLACLCSLNDFHYFRFVILQQSFQIITSCKVANWCAQNFIWAHRPPQRSLCILFLITFSNFS